MSTQTKLDLRVTDRTVFFSLDTVRAGLGGVDAEYVLDRVDNGSLRWVFDIGQGERRRELKFWAREIIAPETANLTLSEVLHLITGPDSAVSRGTLERRWGVHHVTISRWIKARELTELLPGKIANASVKTFLSNRWTGTPARLMEKSTPL